MKNGLSVAVDTTENLRKAGFNFYKVEAEVSWLLAQFVVAKIQEGVINGTLKILPKSEGWAKRARDPRPLINTGKYIGSMRAAKLKGGVSVIKGNFLLAKLLEGGTRNMPARPHIRPAIQTLNRQLGGVLNETFMMGLFGEDYKTTK